MNFCRATADDFPQLAALRWDFRAEGGETPTVSQSEFCTACLAFLHQAAEAGTWTFWVAKDGADIVAHVFVCQIPLVPRPCRLADRMGYLTNFYTVPARRNQGVGKQLLETVCSWARTEDFELLLVSPSDESLSLYQRFGFVAADDFRQARLRDF
ncbi:MAG: GNAT family N-acetyltransferase [Blastocatellia bacterium]|nr:GNAT family N-acetyltransferase [Blastocatellia bacterium]